jgi:hypothetical protein
MQSPVLCVVHLALGCVQILDQGMVAPVCLLNTCDDGRKLPPREVRLGKPGRQPRCQDSQQEQPCELQANVLLATIPPFTSGLQLLPASRSLHTAESGTVFQFGQA